MNVIAERMIKLVNEKERLHADGNTHRIIEEEEQESRDFSLLCIGSRLRKINWGEKQVYAFLKMP